MKLLLKAALTSSKHLSLAVFTMLTMVLLTVSNQLEMCSLGVLTQRSYDFFKVFQTEKMSSGQNRVDTEKAHLVLEEISHGQKEITAKDLSSYLAKRPSNNLLDIVQKKFDHFFDFQKKGVQGLAFLLVFIATLKAFGLFFSRYTTQLLAIRVASDLREKYFAHIQKLPMTFYHQHNIGALSSRVVGDASQIAFSLNAFINNYIHAPFTVLSTLIGCFYLSWQLSMVIFIGLPLVIAPILFVTRKVKKITRQLQKNQERFSSVLIDFLAGIQTVKIFGMEKFSLQKYQEQNNKMAHLESKTAKYDLLTRPILHTITSFCLAFVLIFGLYILRMEISQLLVFCGFLYLFYEPVKRFADENAIIQKGVVAAERLYEVLNLEPEVDKIKGNLKLDGLQESIEFDHVYFKYEDEWILKDVSFRVNKGEAVAIVGATGSGKSTIVKLLPRLYEISSGMIRIDGVPLQKYQQKSLRKKIAFVSQKPFLFFDTIAANISYGRQFHADEILEASKKAHAHEFIASLPKQYETMLEEMGNNLSGGQQQRLAIARALIKKAPILILDEATSSLDAISESKIKETIEGLKGEVTQLIIAHRLTTIEHADRIIFLEDGEKIAEGTLEELLEISKPFRLMWETHFGSKYKEVSAPL